MKPSFRTSPPATPRTDKPRSAATWAKGLAAAGLVMAFSGEPATAAPAVPNIVLVHGAFADGASWSRVISGLQAIGYHVSAVQNPLTSLADDVAATGRVLRRQTGDVLLVGHSWAGAVISEAGNAANVKGLVYLSALAPDSGESVADLLQKLNAPMEGLAPDADGLIWLDDPHQFHRIMAPDLPLRKVRGLAAVQQPIAAAAFTGKVRHAAWHDKPSWYVKTENDRALPPDVQQAIALRIGATVSTVRSAHLPMISRPDVVVRLIDRAAKAAAGQTSVPDARNTQPTP